MITINNIAALNSNLYIAGHPGAPAAMLIAAAVIFNQNANISITAPQPIVILNSTGNLALHGMQATGITIQGGNITLTFEGVAAYQIPLVLGNDAQITFNSEDDFNLEISYKGRSYSIDESLQNIALNETTLDYLALLLESSDFKPPLYDSADDFAIGLLDIISASELREIQAVDKNLIRHFIKSNIVCDDIEDKQAFVESVMSSVFAKVKLVDERFLKMNGVVKSLEAISPENASEPCVLNDIQNNSLYDHNAVWSEIFGYLSSEDTGIAAEFPQVAAMGEDEAKEESKDSE